MHERLDNEYLDRLEPAYPGLAAARAVTRARAEARAVSAAV